MVKTHLSVHPGDGIERAIDSVVNFVSLSPRAVILTNAPREGRARRTLFEADLIGRQDPVARPRSHARRKVLRH